MPKIEQQVGNHKTRPAVPSRRKTSVVDRIESMSLEKTPYLKMLLFGAAGTGKTSLWATFPGPILAIICSGGNQPGELLSIKTEEIASKVRTVTVEHSDELKELIDHCKETKKYKTVVLDHTTGFQDLVLKEVLGLDEIPVTKNWGIATFTDYGTVATKCKRLFRDMLSLPDCNVVFIAQEKWFELKENVPVPDDVMKPTLGAALQKGVLEFLNPGCDYVVQTFKRPKMKKIVKMEGKKERVIYKKVRGADYCLRIEDHEIVTTKFRVIKHFKKPDIVVDPSYEKLVAILKGEYQEKEN